METSKEGRAISRNFPDAVVRANEIRGRERDYGEIMFKQPHLLDLSYPELEERNLQLKERRLAGETGEDLREELLKYLAEEKGIKAVTVCFSDLEGKLCALDYDKKYIVHAEDNLTFDGSSVRGFTELAQSDLRLKVDWSSFRWVPADLFGAGKVLVFADVCNGDGSFYISDFRSHLSQFSVDLRALGVTVNVAPEVEGFLFEGEKAEQYFDEREGFKMATMSGYFSSLPRDTLRLFIDKFAEVQRAFGFQNEKDHPEVAPAQFELSFRYSSALDTADQIQLYKLLARQVAKSMGFTASFLPKPIQNLNGSGMHTNISLARGGKNIFYSKDDKNFLSGDAYKFITGILAYAKDLCLTMNSSVNSYRRLDPDFEAPNEIKFSSTDRGSMIRIPMGNEESTRIEVRTVAPDANPYLYIYALLKSGFEGVKADESYYTSMKERISGDVQILPVDIYEALDYFEKSEFMKDILGEENHRKYAELKLEVAHRSPRALGTRVKTEEVIYHHEVRNQMLWDGF